MCLRFGESDTSLSSRECADHVNCCSAGWNGNMHGTLVGASGMSELANVNE